MQLRRRSLEILSIPRKFLSYMMLKNQLFELAQNNVTVPIFITIRFVHY